MLFGLLMRKKYKRGGIFIQQVLFVISETHDELSGIHVAGYMLACQKIYKYKQKTPSDRDLLKEKS